MKISFKVDRGSIDINQILLIRSTKEIIQFSIDTKQKYPVFSGTSGDYTKLYFGFDKDTLNRNEEIKKLTAVELVGMNAWFGDFGDDERIGTSVFVDTMRYGFHICMAKIKKGRVAYLDETY